MTTSPMIIVGRKTLEAEIKKHPKARSRATETDFRCVMQWIDKGVVIAQQEYVRGYCPRYMIRSQDQTAG
jgi:hypothetical protein